MNIEFPYRKEPSSREGYIYRPVAKVILKGAHGREIIDYFYIDSGADYTLIPYKLGQFLELKPTKSAFSEVQRVSAALLGLYFHTLKCV